MSDRPRRFRSTVPHYARYRLAYPDFLIRRVVALAGLKPGDAILDLGCGPGLLALPFARAGMAVTAVDPEPEMLAALCAAAGELKMDVCQGSSFDLPAGIGPFRLITIGRAFHWMDRAATPKALDGLVLPDGALALFDDTPVRTAENRWHAVLDEVANRFGADQEPHRIDRRSPEHRSHESFLLDSPFPVLESVAVIATRELTADDIVGFTRSLSVTSAEKLGDRAAAFEDELRRELAKLSPEGTFREIAEMRALIARRRV